MIMKLLFFFKVLFANVSDGSSGPCGAVAMGRPAVVGEARLGLRIAWSQWEPGIGGSPSHY